MLVIRGDDIGITDLSCYGDGLIVSGGGRDFMRPITGSGNSNGDIEMLEYTGRPDAPSLRLLVLHDDAEREFDYTAGAEQALDLAAKHAWTVASIKDDWATVFRD
jgi:hypothetical protein